MIKSEDSNKIKPPQPYQKQYYQKILGSRKYKNESLLQDNFDLLEK